jgi:Tfp pilus assembly protein PilF
MKDAEETEPQPNPEEERKQKARECFEQGYECQMRGAVEQATALYKKSIEFLPTAEAYTFLGWVYSFRGRYEEAIEECRKAIQVDPDFGNPYNDIGAYLIEKGRLDEAIPWLEKATLAKRYDSYCFPHYNLGRVWEAKGDWEKALEGYRRALQCNPDYTLARSAMNRLQGLLN